jgi:hypothetical protein
LGVEWVILKFRYERWRRNLKALLGNSTDREPRSGKVRDVELKLPESLGRCI